MCMALTKQSPSCTPLLRTSSCTVSVIFTKPRRSGTSNQRCSVRVFISARTVGFFPTDRIFFISKSKNPATFHADVRRVMRAMAEMIWVCAIAGLLALRAGNACGDEVDHLSMGLRSGFSTSGRPYSFHQTDVFASWELPLKLHSDSLWL